MMQTKQIIQPRLSIHPTNTLLETPPQTTSNLEVTEEDLPIVILDTFSQQNIHNDEEEKVNKVEGKMDFNKFEMEEAFEGLRHVINQINTAKSYQNEFTLEQFTPQDEITSMEAMTENKNMTEERGYNYCSNNNDNMHIPWHTPWHNTECDKIDLHLDLVTPSISNSTSTRTSIIIQNDNYIDLTEMEDDLANSNDSNNNVDDEMQDANLPTFKEESSIPTFKNANVIIIDDSDKEEEEDSIANNVDGMFAMEEIVQELNNEVEKVKKSPVHSREASPVRDIDHNEPKGKSGKGTYRKGGKAIAKGEKEKVLGLRAISPEIMAEENTNARLEKRPHGDENDEKVVKQIKTDDFQETKSSGERRVQKSLSEPRKHQMKWNPAEDANLLYGTPQTMKPILKPSVLTTPSRLQHLKYQFKLKPATALGLEVQSPQGLLTPPTKKFLVKPTIQGRVETILPELTTIRKERAPSIEVIDEAPNVPEIIEIIDYPIPGVAKEEAIEEFTLEILKKNTPLANWGNYQLPDITRDVELVETILPDLTPIRKQRAPSIEVIDEAHNVPEIVEIFDNPIPDIPNEEAIEQHFTLKIPQKNTPLPNWGNYQLPDITRDIELLETILPDLTPIRKERAPSVEVINEATNDPEIVEIINNPVPDVPNEEAIEHFTLEILNEPTCPPNWREINAAPFGEVRPDIVANQQGPQLIDITKDVELIETDSVQPIEACANLRQIYAALFPEVRPELIDITKDVELIETDSVQPIEAGARFDEGPSTTGWQCPDKSCRLLNVNINTRCARCGGERHPNVLVENEVTPLPPLMDLLPVASISSSSTAPDVLPIPGTSSDEPVPSTSSANDANVVETLVPLEEIDHEMRWEQEKEAFLIDSFPDFSPEWLLEQIRSFRMASGTDDAGLNVRVSEIMEMDKSKIPSRKEWEKKIKEQEELDKWSGNMTVKDMLELYEDDPAGHFHNPNRVIPNKQLYSRHSRVGLMDAFRFISTQDIDKMHKHSKLNYTMAYKAINKLAKSRKTKRANAEIKYPADSCIEFLKEKKFVELEAAIEEGKVWRENYRKVAFELARVMNSLTECGCCFEECLKEDMLPCKGGHLYCKECVSRGANVAIGDGKTVIQCLGQCQEEIATRELQKALPYNVLSKLLSKRQAEEIGAADIENLVMCPYCPYSTIMENKEDKVVVCRNPECGRDSCRLCRKPNHIPLRCEELESQDEEQARKRVEEALSDAIIRNCANPKCSARFMKTEGCNKMCCEICKTTQCYLCKSVVKGYDHFYGQGGVPTETKVCPLHSDNDELHASEVARAAQKETAELQKEGIKLKHNPMKDIKIPDKNGAEDNWLVREREHQAPMEINEGGWVGQQWWH